MKYIKVIAGVAVTVLTVAGYAVVQNFHGSTSHRENVGDVVAHVSELFPKFSAFDANKDGQLNGAERDALDKAIADGTLVLPPHTPPEGMFPTREARLDHMVEMYARFATYDANHDGFLDPGEQAALTAAINTGELSFMKEHAQGAGNHAHQLLKSLHSR